MTTEFTGAGDPKRSMELLWGIQERGKRGPKPRLTVEEIARAAIGLADAEGLATLSMRRVAEAVGVSTMSLYTYVPSKAELIDVMLDRVLGETVELGESGGGWREQLAAIARQDWERGKRHPWMLQVGTHRPPLGPNLMAKHEASLAILDGLGLTDLEMDRAAMLLLSYVQGAVRQAVEADLVRQHTGLSDQQWWVAQEPLLMLVLDPTRFPLSYRVGEAVGQTFDAVTDPTSNFEFGLERVLDGLATFIDARKAP